MQRCMVALRSTLQPLGLASRQQALLVHALTTTPTIPHPLCCVQVFQLGNGTDSHAVWREVALLRRCVHERILPLYGVALRASIKRACW